MWIMWNFTICEAANFIFCKSVSSLRMSAVPFDCLPIQSALYIHTQYIHSDSGLIHRLVFLTGDKVIICSGAISLVAPPPSV